MMRVPKEFATLKTELREALEELLDVACLRPGQILVVGCSTSEIGGAHIGSAGSVDIAKTLMPVLLDCVIRREIQIAIQCCEHLNRALVVERTTAEAYHLVEVSVRPIPTAGGAMAATAMDSFEDPVVVESIQAHAGIDIGLTLIGMHLLPVAVPVRLRCARIGEATVVAARTRPRFIGGPRAEYK